MKTLNCTINSSYGIHARPAVEIFKLCSSYECDITFRCKKRRANAKNIMGLLGLGACKGDVLSIEFQGHDEVDAYNGLQKFLLEL